MCTIIPNKAVCVCMCVCVEPWSSRWSKDTGRWHAEEQVAPPSLAQLKSGQGERGDGRGEKGEEALTGGAEALSLLGRHSPSTPLCLDAEDKQAKDA